MAAIKKTIKKERIKIMTIISLFGALAVVVLVVAAHFGLTAK